MGNPVFRFTLTNSVLGSLEISEPLGWKSAKLKLERHEEYHSLVEYFDGSFIFYGDNGVDNGGADFIRSVEQIEGVDGTIDITIEVSFDDGYNYENIFSGQLDLEGLQEVKNNKIEVPIVRNDLWSKFISRSETPVNIQSETSLDEDEVDVHNSINLNLTSQKLRQNYSGNFEQGYLTYSGSSTYINQYVQVDFIDEALSEIEKKYNLPLALNTEVPVWLFEMEYEGNYDIDLRIEASRATVFISPNGNDLTNGGDYYVRYYIQINQDAPIELTKTNYSVLDGSTVYTYSGNHNLLKGATIRIYGYFAYDLPFANILFYWGVNNDHVANNLGVPSFDFRPAPSGVANPTFLHIIANTIFPATNSPSFFVHDVFGQILDRITTQGIFYSEILGSTQTIYRQYDADGCGWMYANAKGLQIRKYSLLEKPFFQSFKQQWQGIDPILCLALMYDTINGQEMIVILPREDVFNPTPLVFLDDVYEITREYDKDQIYKSIKIGYKKWQGEDISGIDDPQTKRTYAPPLKKSGKEITIESEFIAASLTIETTRRKTREKSADYKFDNDTFIIAVNPNPVTISPETSPDVEDYIPELDDYFNSITSLLNSSTRYNSRLTPARNLIRHEKFLNVGLQSLNGGSFKFVYGEGNYDMTSQMYVSTPGCDDDYDGQVLDEGGDIPIENDNVYLAQEFKIEIDLSWDDYVTIRENRDRAIGISQTDTDHKAFFIKLLEYELVQSRATITLWPVEPFDISVIDFQPRIMECPINEACENAITDLLGDNLVDSFGECITTI
jgi:hypothetical protein